MPKLKPYQKVIDYFQTLESKAGYNLILGGIKHFGFYPSGKDDIPEKKAQILMIDLIAKTLNLTKNDNILDAGCGQGQTAIYLAKKYGGKITGITITPFEVKRAEKSALKIGQKNVRFLEMDYSETNFPDNYFDKIYTLESLVHAYNLQKTLKEFKRILKPKGKIAFFEYSMIHNEKLKNFTKNKVQNFASTYEWVIEKSAMLALKKLRHGKLVKILRQLDFVKIKEKNITRNIYPSMAKLYRLARLPYVLIKLFHLQNLFINTTIAKEFFSVLIKNSEDDLFRYNITTAQKR